MPSTPFTIVDVFAERRYAGNQLAVFTDAGGLDAAEMQALAHETNFSETTFVVDAKPTVRIFTPREELPFAGHPTLGTAAVLMGDAREITLHLKVGPITVRREGDLYWMRQNPASFGRRVDAKEVAPMLSIPESEIVGPVEEVSTGLPHLVVPIASVEALRRVKLDAPRYHKLVAGLDAQCIFPFAVGASDPRHHVTVRQFALNFGIHEDPATGSGNGSLAAYLSRHKVLGSEVVDVRSEQGANLGRPSLLHLKARPGPKGIDTDVSSSASGAFGPSRPIDGVGRSSGNAIHVDVGGKVQWIAEGRLVG